MNKIPKILLSVILSCLLLTSCISVEKIPLDSTGSVASQETPTAPPAGNDPAVPVWSESQIRSAAEDILLFPSSGVVNVSTAEYSYREMEEDLQTLAALYPQYFSCRTIGKSAAGRDLYLGVLGDPSAPRQVVVSAAIHAREYMTAQLVMKQIEFYLTHYNTGSYGGIPYATLFSECCFYIVPMTNPDGVMLSLEGLDSLPNEELKETVREIFRTEPHGYKSLDLYLSRWKANARGVDLNRNYDALWEQYSGASQPQSYQYKGPSPASEPETQAMVSLIEGLDNVVCVLCIHSQGEVIYWNCGQEETAAARTLKFTKAVAARNGYQIETERNNDASLSDWCELNHSIPAITVETGNEMCPLSIGQFRSIWLCNYDLLPLTAHYWITEE